MTTRGSRPPVIRALRPAARRAMVTYRHRGLRPVDLVLASYPKSGNTWLRFVLASALTGREIDFDSVVQFSPPVGEHRGGARIVPGDGRLVKSHELPRFVGRRDAQPRVVCLVRDGRDVCTSYYFHLRRRGLVTGTFEEEFEAIVTGRAGAFGSWHGHVRAWLDYAATVDTVMFVKYEDLLAEPAMTFAAVNDRFDLGLDEATMATAIERNEAAQMRQKEASSQRIAQRAVVSDVPFVREARAYKWRDTLTPAQVARVEELGGAELRELGYPSAADLDHR